MADRRITLPRKRSGYFDAVDCAGGSFERCNQLPLDAVEGGKKGDTAALVTHEKAALESAKTVYASTVGSLSATDLARFGDATHDVC